MAIICPGPLTYARQRPITASHSSRHDMLAIISSRYQCGPFFIFCCRSYVKLLDYWRAEKNIFSTSGGPLRPVAFATSATWLIRHWARLLKLDSQAAYCLCSIYVSRTSLSLGYIHLHVADTTSIIAFRPRARTVFFNTVCQIKCRISKIGKNIWV